MSRKLRVLSNPSAELLRRFIDEPDREFHGFELIVESGIRSSTLYPALRLLAEDRHYLDSRWEQIDPDVVKRPPRRLYRLNAAAGPAARKALAEADAHNGRDRRALKPSAAGGIA